MGNHEKTFALATVKFTDEVNELPLPYVNAVVVQSGVDDFFITIGAVVPPAIKSSEDLKQYSEIEAKPLFRFALSRSNLEEFISTLQEQYANQTRFYANYKER